MKINVLYIYIYNLFSYFGHEVAFLFFFFFFASYFFPHVLHVGFFFKYIFMLLFLCFINNNNKICEMFSISKATMLSSRKPETELTTIHKACTWDYVN